MVNFDLSERDSSSGGLAEGRTLQLAIV